MRDPNRIDTFLTKLGEYWKNNVPDWRFMQLISNIQCQCGSDLFYTEEEQFLKLLDEFFTTNGFC